MSEPAAAPPPAAARLADPPPLGALERARDWLRGVRADWRDARERRAYARRSAPPPPHGVKARALLDVAARHRLETLVETGTFQGEMVRRCLGRFRRIVTIELDPGHARRAARRFAGRAEVEVWQGDSGRVLAEVIATLAGPALFWLDGHFSGAGTARGERDTPLEAEIEAIVGRGERRDVVMIDDARLLGAGDYPDLATLAGRLAPLHPGGSVSVADDMVFCLPRPEPDDA